MRRPPPALSWGLPSSATLALLVCGCTGLASFGGRPDTPVAPATGTRGMVSTAHPIATEAGLEILRAGGNAFDAAVAVAAPLNVVEPMMSGIGGYGTILVFDAATGSARYLDASGKIPRATDPDVYRPPTPNYQDNRKNGKAVSTPGAVRAWEAMSARHGRLPWRDLFAPAIRAADGHLVDARTARLLDYVFAGLPAAGKAIYGSQGRALREGEALVQTDLGNTLRTIAEQGAAAVYGGEIGQAIDRQMRTADGFLRLADLETARAEWWDPIAIQYRGRTVVTPSAPAGAFPMLLRLGMMSLVDVNELGHNSVDYLHRFAEVTKHAYWTRLRYSGDPEVQPPPYDLLLTEDYWRAQNARLDLERARPFTREGIATGAAESNNTTHFVVADSAGNVVSATVTLGQLFGSRILVDGTGIWLNNSLAYCTYEPPGNPMDAHPGRRKLSSDSPSFVMRDGRVEAAFGTPGGHTITQTTAQMILNFVDFGMNVQEAITAPRIAFVEPQSLRVDPMMPSAVCQALAARGHEVEQQFPIGDAHALSIEYDGDGEPALFLGASDPRGGGLAQGY